MKRGLPLSIAVTLAFAGCVGPSVPLDPPKVAPAPTGIAMWDAPRREDVLLAVKTGTRVLVQAVDNRTGVARPLFAYRERHEAEHSGNFWSEMAPSIARSATRNTLAFGADDGLHLIDLGSGSRTTLIERRAPGVDEDTPPTWSEDLDAAYGLYMPRWSPNGRYLSFVVSRYEGHSIWFYDVATRRLFRQEGLPASSYADPVLGEVSWAPEGSTSVVPQTVAESGASSSVGLVWSAIGNPAKARLLPLDVEHVGEAALSPDAAVAALSFGRRFEAMTTLGVVRGDDSRVQIVDDESGEKVGPTFDQAGALWWIRAGREERALFRWDGRSVARIAKLDARFGWRILSVNDGTVAIAGRSAQLGSARYIQIAADNGRPLAQHETDNDFATYLAPA